MLMKVTEKILPIITNCFTVGNRAFMHRSTTLSCYKYLLMLY
jgi:hypothetical protein